MTRVPGKLEQASVATQFEMLSGADMITSGPSGCLSMSKQNLHTEFLPIFFNEHLTHITHEYIYILID